MKFALNVYVAFLVKNKHIERVTELIRRLCLSTYTSASNDANHHMVKQWLRFGYSRCSKRRFAVTVHLAALSRIRLFKRCHSTVATVT